MKFKPQGQFVLLGIPREARFAPGYKGSEDVELPNLRVGGILFPVIEIGDEVYQLKVGDQVLLPQEDGAQVTTLKLEDEKYVLIQAFDIVIRLKRENELNVIKNNTIKEAESSIFGNSNGTRTGIAESLVINS